MSIAVAAAEEPPLSVTEEAPRVALFKSDEQPVPVASEPSLPVPTTSEPAPPAIVTSRPAPLMPPKAGMYDYELYAVERSLKKARETHLLLRGVNTDSLGGALEDCVELAEMSADELQSVRAELIKWRSQSDLSQLEGVDRVRTRLSSALTYADTCLDGMQEEGISSGVIYDHMQEASKLYGLTLDLVSTAIDRVVPMESLPRDAGVRLVSISPPTKSPSILVAVINGVPASRTVTVAKDGSGNFTSVTDAVAFAPEKASRHDGYFKIIIKEGVYDENVLIKKNKKRLILLGAGNSRTVITGHRSVADGWRTYKTATLAVHGRRFIACNLTFENTAGPEKHQAVAVRNTADHSVFYLTTFLGYQDTLYAHANKQFYRDCSIFGTVDFIFGNAAAVFQNCNIYARKPMLGQKITITAQGRKCPSEKTGFSIHNCSVRAAPDLENDLGSTKAYLGRPWKNHSRTAFIQSSLSELIDPAGWLEWEEGRAVPETIYYGEYGNQGPGADTSRRVEWPGYRRMNRAEALSFTVYNLITGARWLEDTSVPFELGLIS